MDIVKNFKIDGKNIIIREVKTVLKNEPYLCGYVEVTKDNKYFDKDYNEIDFHSETLYGLEPTFSGIIPFDCFEKKYYIGFDCGESFMNSKEYNLENVEKVCKELYDFIYENEKNN
ncbi:hypothetical protein [Fusobacterium polymorphum]|uniref:Uncharacterized protein n=1 Tax=Fusobacterium nucleatum subsp. polymorphum TaxID=76857 RepID=A0A2C6BJA1_FUSNP|nr:hypothetical protein [Fusobacterium polymorphum]PHI06586.1 hypothetical protein CBG54_05845 [Fusobacterium polymorphum]